MSDFRQPVGVHLGAVYLRVSDLGRSLEFYRDLLGMSVVSPGVAGALGPSGESGGVTLLSAHPGGPALVGLVVEAGVAPRPARTLGLYHFALLFPERLDLARTVQRLLDHRWPIEGASDHVVSEAVYLSDPDGNGVELYVDRPSDLWRWDSGGIVMRTMPLDLPGLLIDFRDELDSWSGMAPGTVVGHIHLHVSDLGRAESFYHDLLGFEVTSRVYAGALFLAAGGYHHHIGVNIWAGPAPSRRGTEIAGLDSFEIVIPDSSERSRIREDAARQGAEGMLTARGWKVRDFDGNLVVIRD